MVENESSEDENEGREEKGEQNKRPEPSRKCQNPTSSCHRSPWFHLSNALPLVSQQLWNEESRLILFRTPALNSVHLFFVCLFVSFLVIDSLYWASVAPFSLQDATVGRAFSASEVEPRILALRMTLLMTSTAPLKTTTAEETLCLCRTDTGSGAPATSARPAAPPGCSPFCPWTGRCTVLWIATAWSPWSGALLPSHLLLDSSCQRWGRWNLQLLGRELWLVAGRNGFRFPHVCILLSLTSKGQGSVQSSYELILPNCSIQTFLKWIKNVGWVS